MKKYDSHVIKKYDYVQLELIPETLDERNSREIREMKEHQNKVRKSIYAKHSKLERDFITLKSEFDNLVRLICNYQKVQPRQRELL